MRWTAEVRLWRPDGLQTDTRRTVELEAPDRVTALLVLPEEARAGGYSGFRLDSVLSLKPVDEDVAVVAPPAAIPGGRRASDPETGRRASDAPPPIKLYADVKTLLTEYDAMHLDAVTFVERIRGLVA